MRTPIFSCCLIASGLLIGASSSALLGAAETSDAYATPPSLQPVDPKLVIREKAMARAQARASRMAANSWYGHAPARPRASATPLVGTGPMGRTPGYRAPRRTVLYWYR